METATVLRPDQWAEQTCGQAQVRDARRTRRAVTAAGEMVRDPAASLPKHQPTWKAVTAVSRVLKAPDVTGEALMRPPWRQTRAAVDGQAIVLLVQDTTELDLSPHAAMTGLGQIGTGRGRGLLVQTGLAVLPETRAVLGCLAHRPVVRVAAPPQEQRSQRRQRAQRETDIWMQMGEQVGTPAATGRLVHVGDRGGALLSLFWPCRLTQTHVVLRAAQNRRVRANEEEIAHLLDRVRAWPSQAQRPFDVPASHGRPGRPARRTRLQISFGSVSVLPPWNDPRGSTKPLPIWVVRGWETEPPAGEDALEWILRTSLETATCAHAWQRGDWSRCRWIVEEDHHCLKTGCRIAARQVDTAERLIRLLGLMSPRAVRLVQVRDVARRAPESAAAQSVTPAAVALVAARVALPPERLTGAAFWPEVARLGGSLARTRDGPPGWRTLWQGWLYLQTLVEGVHLASHLRL
jgi:Transposase DNA-binding